LKYQPINHSDPEKISKIEQKACFERVFNSPDGQIILKILANECIPEMGIYDPDSHRVSFREGKRNLFMTILKLSSLSMENFVKMFNWDEKWETEHNEQKGEI
jgi:hypothetical protein